MLQIDLCNQLARGVCSERLQSTKTLNCSSTSVKLIELEEVLSLAEVAILNGDDQKVDQL